jgi:hypothetical protein
MVQTVTLIVIILCAIVIFVCLAQVVRIRFWSNFVDREIERAYKERRAGREARYPDVHASWDNFKWHQPFRYNFKSMIVYDTTR